VVVFERYAGFAAKGLDEIDSVAEMVFGFDSDQAALSACAESSRILNFMC
jgi:hypothetical protein